MGGLKLQGELVARGPAAAFILDEPEVREGAGVQAGDAVTLVDRRGQAR